MFYKNNISKKQKVKPGPDGTMVNEMKHGINIKTQLERSVHFNQHSFTNCIKCLVLIAHTIL